jgi:hypothetical protein
MAGIVIIQSKDVVRALYREAFERAGYFVHETAEGLKASAAFKNGRCTW